MMRKSDLSFENIAGKAQVIWVGMLFPKKSAEQDLSRILVQSFKVKNSKSILDSEFWQVKCTFYLAYSFKVYLGLTYHPYSNIKEEERTKSFLNIKIFIKTI